MSDLTPLEQRAIQARKEKFKLEKLQYERVAPKDALPKSLDTFTQKEQAHWKTLMADYKEKFRMSALQVEDGPLARRLEEAQSIADYSAQVERERALSNNSKLKTALASVNGKQVRLWLEVSK